MTENNRHASVAIVGGGLAGLSAAAILARAGHAVTIFEKSSHPGGRATTKQHDAFFFNQGAHALYQGGHGETLLNELGVSYSGASPDPGSYLALDGEKLHALPTGVGSMLGTTLLKLGAKGELIRLFSTLKQIRIADIQNVSLQDWLEQRIQHPQVRRFLLAGARIATYTNAPELLSAGLLLPLLTARVRYLDGGWQTLVDGLWQAAQQAGAQMVTHARVAGIEVGEEGHTVRLADGTRHAASAVLLATDPGTASELIANGTHEALSRWAAQSVPARAACLDVALRRLPEPGHLVALGIDRPLYYSAHSAYAKLAPEGGALIHVMKYLRPDDPAEPETTRQEMEEMLDRVQPGWRTEVVKQYFLPHMIVSNAIIQAGQGGLSGRPGPAIPGVRNLYVAGDWVGPEGQLSDASFASASSAATMIMTTLAAQKGSYAVTG
ncbi:MAG: NAD(P)/FAD-dependent oxidoreductase [Ktedonobacteraceae bacterium]|nr:NAD(P)/FAD-dependent oxidoreductase [Ktedonobacteraceae bacterium]